MSKKQTYTEEQVNGLLDRLIEIKREHDSLRVEIALLRTLLTKSALQDSSHSGFKYQPSTLPQP